MEFLFCSSAISILLKIWQRRQSIALTVQSKLGGIETAEDGHERNQRITEGRDSS